MTPEYIWSEMDLSEVQEAISHVMRWELHPVSKEHYKHLTDGMDEWLAPGGSQDLSWIKGPIGKVIRKHGN